MTRLSSLLMRFYHIPPLFVQQRFRPISVERPKVLMPLVNVPMLDYTLEWLAYAGVEEVGCFLWPISRSTVVAACLSAFSGTEACEQRLTHFQIRVQVFVFCCAHAAQIEAYLESSKWTSVPNFAVHTIVSTDCVSVGEVCSRNGAACSLLEKTKTLQLEDTTVNDRFCLLQVAIHRSRRSHCSVLQALRLVDQRNVIRSDFVLISGDTVRPARSLADTSHTRKARHGADCAVAIRAGGAIRRRQTSSSAAPRENPPPQSV